MSTQIFWVNAIHTMQIVASSIYPVRKLRVRNSSEVLPAPPNYYPIFDLRAM